MLYNSIIHSKIYLQERKETRKEGGREEREKERKETGKEKKRKKGEGRKKQRIIEKREGTIGRKDRETERKKYRNVKGRKKGQTRPRPGAWQQSGSTAWVAGIGVPRPSPNTSQVTHCQVE